MAILNTTSPGQLSKYVIPTIQRITRAMETNSAVSRGSAKAHRIKNNDANRQALLEFQRIGNVASSQRDALSIQLEVVDSKQGTISIGSIDKPNVNYNFGDMAEGVVGAAITARFIYKNRRITPQHVYAIIYGLPTPQNYPGKRGKYTEKMYKSLNANKNVSDDVKFYLSLAEVNMVALTDKSNKEILRPYVLSAVRFANSNTVTKWSKLLYENNKHDFIEVISDGLGGQTTTKVDVYVKVDDQPIDIKVSLKAGDVKQFGQVSGIEFEKQRLLWERSFALGPSLRSLEARYTELVADDDAPAAVRYVYEQVASQFNQRFRTNRVNDLVENLSNSIKYFATLDEDNVVLLQVGNDAAKLYTFDQIYNTLKNLDLSANVTSGRSGLPTLTITESSSNTPIIQYRVKQEFKPDGTPYIRNYVEKMSGLGSIIGENL